jgi:hypothetical protein
MRLSLIEQVRGSLREIGPAAVLNQLAVQLRGMTSQLPPGTCGAPELARAAEAMEGVARSVPPTFRFPTEEKP